MTTRIAWLTIVLNGGCFPGPLPPDADTAVAPETSSSDTVVDTFDSEVPDTAVTSVDSVVEIDASECQDAGDCAHLAATCKAVACVDHACVVSDDDAAACSDDDPCTTGDHCDGGVCASTPKTCPVSTDPCRENVCNDAGACESRPANDALGCDDGDPCTTGDACVTGACTGAQRACESDDTCQVDGHCEATSATTFICDFDERPDEAGCDDGQHCTVGEECTDGECGGGVLPTDEDWIYRLDSGLTYGRTALTVDAFGTTWWFVSLTEPVTTFAPGVSATLPRGATSGIARVELDAQGVPRYAHVLVHSTGEVRIPYLTQRFATVVSKTGNPNGAQSTYLFGTFDAPVTYTDAQGALETATPLHARSYFLGVFDNSGVAERFLQIESGQFSAQDTAQGVFPSVGVGPTGAAVVVVPVRAERDAAIVGRTTAPPSTGSSDWVLYYSPTGVLGWQGELGSPPPPAVGTASTVYAAVDITGSAWLGGQQFGTVLWNRIDGIGVSGQTPVSIAFQDSVITRLSADGDYLGAAHFTAGSTLRTNGASVDSLGARFATTLYFQQDLFVVEGGASRVIAADDPLSTTQIGLVTVNAQLQVEDVVVSSGVNLAWFDFRPDALVVALLGGADLRRGSDPVFGDDLAPHGINIGGMPFSAAAEPWTFAALTTPSSASNIGIADRQIALSRAYGLVIAGRVETQQHTIPASGEAIAVDEAFVLRLNSQDGRACRGR